MHSFSLVFLALVVGTWNGNWFPSGRAEHHANKAVETATIQAAGEMLRAGAKQTLGTASSGQPDDYIFCVNEVRGPVEAVRLCAAIGIPGLKVACVSRYRAARGDRYDQQQDVIFSTLPVLAADFSAWKKEAFGRMGRGYVRATLQRGTNDVLSVYAVHLKSNYGASRNPDEAELNRQKREACARQLRTAVKGLKTVLICGDFNMDPWRKEFASEETVNLLLGVGFQNALALLSPKCRGTFPTRSYGTSALDHVLYRGLVPVERPWMGTAVEESLSDHNPVFMRFQ